MYVSVSAARWDRRRLCMRPCAAVLELLWWTFWCTLSRCYTPHNERHDLIVAVASVQINKWHGRSHAYVVAEHWSALAEASGCARGWEYAETYATKVVIQQSVEKCVRWRAYENAARRGIASTSARQQCQARGEHAEVEVQPASGMPCAASCSWSAACQNRHCSACQSLALLCKYTCQITEQRYVACHWSRDEHNQGFWHADVAGQQRSV